MTRKTAQVKKPAKGTTARLQPLRLPVAFRDAVSALLKTPPPPMALMPERPKAKKATKRKGAQRKAAKAR